MTVGNPTYTFTCTCGHRESGLSLAEGNDLFDTHLEPGGSRHEPVLRREDAERTIAE